MTEDKRVYTGDDAIKYIRDHVQKTGGKSMKDVHELVTSTLELIPDSTLYMYGNDDFERAANYIHDKNPTETELLSSMEYSNGVKGFLTKYKEEFVLGIKLLDKILMYRIGSGLVLPVDGEANMLIEEKLFIFGMVYMRLKGVKELICVDTLYSIIYDTTKKGEWLSVPVGATSAVLDKEALEASGYSYSLALKLFNGELLQARSSTILSSEVVDNKSIVIVTMEGTEQLYEITRKYVKPCMEYDGRLINEYILYNDVCYFRIAGIDEDFYMLDIEQGITTILDSQVDLELTDHMLLAEGFSVAFYQVLTGISELQTNKCSIVLNTQFVKKYPNLSITADKAISIVERWIRFAENDDRDEKDCVDGMLREIAESKVI